VAIFRRLFNVFINAQTKQVRKLINWKLFKRKVKAARRKATILELFSDKWRSAYLILLLSDSRSLFSVTPVRRLILGFIAMLK